MANLTQYTGGTSSEGGATIGQWVGTEAEYASIAVKDPFTLYFVTEN